MKTILLPAMVVLLTYASSCKTTKSETTCIDPARINPHQMCTMQYDPVCGCDGKTYGNACEAQRAGVTSYSSGECLSKK